MYLHKKLRFIVIAIITLILLAAACSATNERSNKPEANPVAAVGPSVVSGKSSTRVSKDSGSYVGRIDANSIEIRISGVPEKYSARAFRLSEEVKARFDSYGLVTNDQIWVSYI